MAFAYDANGNELTKEEFWKIIDQQNPGQTNVRYYNVATDYQPSKPAKQLTQNFAGEYMEVPANVGSGTSPIGTGAGSAEYYKQTSSGGSSAGSYNSGNKYANVGDAASYAPDYSFNYQQTPVGQAYNRAMEKIGNELGDRPAYDNKYDKQLEDAYLGIVNRNPFSWSEETDPFWKKYKQRYTELGQQAMKDTMGQAAALTGGYGNTYAQFAGQGAYNRYMDALADKSIELEERAYQRYQDAGDELYRQYTLLGDLRDNAYGQYRDAVSDYNYNLALLQAQEAEDYARAQYLNNLRIQAEQEGYGRYRDALNDARYEDELGYSRWRDEVSDQRYADETAYARARDEVTDSKWWNEYNLDQAKLDTSNSQWWNEYALKQRQVDLDERELALKYAGAGGSGGGGGGGGSGGSSSESNNENNSGSTVTRYDAWSAIQDAKNSGDITPEESKYLVSQLLNKRH